MPPPDPTVLHVRTAVFNNGIKRQVLLCWKLKFCMLVSQGITAVACSICDEAGARPFRSVKLLQAHVKVEHGRSLCDVCLSVSIPLA